MTLHWLKLGALTNGHEAALPMWAPPPLPLRRVHAETAVRRLARWSALDRTLWPGKMATLQPERKEVTKGTPRVEHCNHAI